MDLIEMEMNSFLYREIMAALKAGEWKVVLFGD
jgi:hypothetical protein